jgi:phage terminase large subunit
VRSLNRNTSAASMLRSLGAFYAREMVNVRKEGRIVDIEALPDREVHRAWDIGVRDDTSIWWFQMVGTQVYILDCYSASGVGVDHYATVIEERRRISTSGRTAQILCLTTLE